MSVWFSAWSNNLSAWVVGAISILEVLRRIFINKKWGNVHALRLLITWPFITLAEKLAELPGFLLHIFDWSISHNLIGFCLRKDRFEAAGFQFLSSLKPWACYKAAHGLPSVCSFCGSIF
jgi:hypothetical protein